MKFYYSLYELQPKKFRPKDPLPPVRKGAILKVEWNDEQIGYADLHPWPEFGDLELESQLAELRQMRLTPLVEQAIWLASIDAKGRKDRKNTFDNQSMMKNNALLLRINPYTVELLDPLVKQGFTKVKFKVGENIEDEIGLVNRVANTHQMIMRLDFNSRLTWASFQKFVDGLSPTAKRQIEYVEDPFPYNPEQWSKARKLVPMAIDWELKRVPHNQKELIEADVLVLKPTHDDVNVRVDQALRCNARMTVTSHMGHPLGVMQCMQVAQDLQSRYPNYVLDPGCMTFDVYEPTEYHSLLNIQGPYIRKVGGWGIGFDFVLKSQKWNQLRTR